MSEKLETVVCPLCQHENSLSAKICVVCDYPLDNVIAEYKAKASEREAKKPTNDSVPHKMKDKHLRTLDSNEFIDKKQHDGRIVKCHECGYMNRIGAIFCEDCGAALKKYHIEKNEPEPVEKFGHFGELFPDNVEDDDDIENHMESSDEIDTQLLSDPTDAIPRGCFKFSSWMILRFDIEGHDIPIYIKPKPDKPILIGRSHESMSIQPDIDLTPYLIKKHGVSRRHAVIRLHETRLDLIDLNSKNGTSINSVQFYPKARHELRHQDAIKIGRIQILISFVREDQASHPGQTDKLYND